MAKSLVIWGKCRMSAFSKLFSTSVSVITCCYSIIKRLSR